MKKYKAHMKSIIEGLMKLDIYNEDNLNSLISTISYNPQNIEFERYLSKSLVNSNEDLLYIYTEEGVFEEFFIKDDYVYINCEYIELVSDKYNQSVRDFNMLKDELYYELGSSSSRNYLDNLHYDYKFGDHDNYMEKLESLCENNNTKISFDLNDLKIKVNDFRYFDISDVKLTQFGLFAKIGKITKVVDSNFLSNVKLIDLESLTVSKLEKFDTTNQDNNCYYHNDLGVFHNVYSANSIPNINNGSNCFFVLDKYVLTVDLEDSININKYSDIDELLKSDELESLRNRKCMCVDDIF